MPKASLFLDRRSPKKSGAFPLKISFSSQSRTAYAPTGIDLSLSEWDAASSRVSDKHPRWRSLRPYAQSLLLDAQMLCLSKPSASAKELAALFKRRSEGEDAAQVEKRPFGLLEALRATASKATPSTRLVIERTIKHVSRFLSDRDIPLESATKGWLQDFDADLSAFSPSPNARAIHMRNIRAAFNYAIDEGLCQAYPFRKYKIKTVPTAKRSLSAQEMRLLMEMDCEDWIKPYREFFFLSFALLGANPKDLLFMPPSALDKGRVSYSRSKTGKLYDIKAEPEALALIGKRRGKEHLLDVMDSRKDYLQFVRQCDRALSRLRPGLTMYWARHSWATIAASLDIPKETIAKGLGHAANSVTDIYIAFDTRKVDEANRRVLDAVGWRP